MPDIWVPLTMRSGAEREERGSRGLEMIGRLKDDVTIPQVQGTMSSLAKQLAETYPDTNRGLGVDVGLTSPGPVRYVVIGFMAILMVIVGLVLLIACTNVGAMTLARASARRKELAVRLAIGAGRWRIIRQLLIESVLLFLIGGAAGILLAVWAIRFFLSYKLPAECSGVAGTRDGFPSSALYSPRVAGHRIGVRPRPSASSLENGCSQRTEK